MAQEAEGYGGYQGYGGYGAPMDPASMRAKLAMAMLQQGSDSSPIRSPWQGAARMSNALFGALMMRQQQDQYAKSWQGLGPPPGAGGVPGGAPGGVPGGGSPGLPPQPGALSDLTNDPDMQRGVANAATNGLPDSATIGASMQRGPSPPQMGPPMPGMAPNNSAGGTMIPGYMGGAGAPGGNNAGGPPPANMTAQAGRPPLDPRMMVAGPGVPSLPPSGPAPGNSPQGAGAGSFNPQDLAMFQQDMQGVPGTPAGGGGGPPGGGGNVGQYIAQKAASMGIDPNVALKVAGGEGLNAFNPNAPDRGGDGGSSFGPFQLHYGGMNPAMPNPGLGDAFTKATGLNARDPSTWKQQVDFALSQAQQGGWGPWMGAKAHGITGFAGIGQPPSGGAPPSALAFNGGQPPPPSGPALAAIQGAAGPPGGGPAPNNMFAQDMQGVPGGPSAPQGQVPGSMQPNMMVAGPGVPSGARGGAPPPMPPPGAMGPPPGGGGGNPLSALGNMFGIGNPSSPQGGSSPAPAGGGAPGGDAMAAYRQQLMQVMANPYADPKAREYAMQLMQTYGPHPMTWETMPGTNNLAQKDFWGNFTGRVMPGPHQTSVVDAGTDFMGVKHQSVFDKDAPLGQQVTVIDPATGRPTSVSPGQGGGVPPSSPTGSSVTPASPGAKVWSPGQPLDPSVDSKLQGLVGQYAGNDPRAQGMVYQYAKALLQGNQQFVATGTVAKAPYIEAAETIARQIDPDGMPQTRFDTIKSNADMSAPTSLGGQRMAAQTSVRHMGALADATDLLANQGQISSSEMGAKVQNWAMRNLGGASSGFVTASQAYDAGLVPVLGEIDKLYKGGQASEGEIMFMKENLAPTASPDAKRAALGMLSGLLQDKVQVLQDTWHMGTGKNFPDLPIIDQKGQASLDYIKNWKAGGNFPPPPIDPNTGKVTTGQVHVGGAPSNPIIPGGAQAAPAQSQQGDPLSQARAAIAKGAPRAAVIQRLQAMGVNPAGL